MITRILYYTPFGISLKEFDTAEDAENFSKQLEKLPQTHIISITTLPRDSNSNHGSG